MSVYFGMIMVYYIKKVKNKLYCDTYTNRKLRKLERYLREHSLLFEYEYLYIDNESERKPKGRAEIANHIGKVNGWLDKDDVIFVINSE